MAKIIKLNVYEKTVYAVQVEEMTLVFVAVGKNIKSVVEDNRLPE